jgi:hypothetical protein
MLFIFYPPVTYSDTGGYLRAAQAVVGGFENYDGTRTPVYPVFIALLGSELAVYVGQLILGLMITLAWFVIGWKVGGRPVWGGLAALVHTLNPGQFFFEASLLTETLATFWLLLSLLGACFWLVRSEHPSAWLALGIGLSASLAALTRPQFIFMPFLLAIFLSFTFPQRRLHFSWQSFFGVLLPAILIIGGWMGWLHSRYKIFSLTAMSGFHMVQHTGYYFEDVPDDYAGLRDVYLDYRDDRLAKYGTQSNTIWDAIPAMQEASGMGFYELSRTLQEISVKLIMTHPWQYLWRVIKGLGFYWRAPVYWQPEGITNSTLSALMGVWVLGARGLMVMMNAVFILTSAAALLLESVRKYFKLGAFHWLIASSIWLNAFLSALLEHGENQRFLIPLQTAVIFWGFWCAGAFLKNRSLNREKLVKING